MKRTLSMITLAVLTIGLLGSCSKINERLDNLEKKVDGIENEQIATINGQIAGIESSIADLKQIRSDIGNLKQTAESHGEDIFDLQEADETLGSRIDNLEDYLENVLPNYAEKEWVEATYSTLDQYDSTCTAIAEINVKIGELDTKLSEDIKACADSMTEWINVKFKGYYTAAEMNAELAKMRAAVDSAKSAGGITDTKADSVAAELTKMKTAVDTAKANIRKEYKAAIKTAIETSEGKLTKEITDKITAVNTAVTNLTKRVDKIERDVKDLLDRVKALEGMIQSVSVIPVYDDGSVEANGIILTVDFIVSPAKVADNLADKDIQVLINEVEDVATRAVSYKSLEARIDTVVSGTGMITIKADVSSVAPADGHSLVAAVKVKDGKGSDCTSEFHPVYYGESNVNTSTDGTVTKVKISDKSDNPKVSGGILDDQVFTNDSTSIEVEGIATVTFNKKATETIRTKAGSTDVIFKVEDVTTTKPVKDADVVLEVTMKTVGEDGKEVFSENKDGCEVTIEIPIGNDVAYVKKVTLVDEAGNPIDGGVVPGSEKVEDGKLIFKVNHFSKYAIDYVTNEDYKNVTGVSLNVTSVSLPVGDSAKFKATISPDNATNKKVIWSSSDPTKVTVDTAGTVKAIAFGTATITVTTDDGNKTATCTVKVTETKTMSELLATNPDIPKVKDMTPPANAWVNSADTACKAFVGYDGQDTLFVAYKRVSKDQETDEIISLGLCMDDTFEKTDGDTYKRVEKNVGTFTAKMTEGKFTSFEFEAASGSDYADLNGTYAAPASPLPAGALSSEFTVNAQGKKVHFSQGNLQATYNGASYTWDFAANQYAYIGNAAGNTTIGTQTDGAVVDLFGWSTNGNSVNYGINTLDSYYTEEFVDWGKNIGDGITWRTLTLAEWQYLFNTRTMTDNGCRYENLTSSGITVDGVTFKGVVLFPDDFTEQSTWRTKYKTWEALNGAGLVFLPAAGSRMYSTVNSLDDEFLSGSYWSSTPLGSVSAYYVCFSVSSNEVISLGDGVLRGVSVRLVTDVPAE